MTQYEQSSLFSSPTAADAGGSYRIQQPSLLLEIQPDVLEAWKHRVFHYQQRVREQPTPQQGALFELDDSPGAIADTLNPFTLPRQNTEFWRWKATDSGVSSVYFVIDEVLPLLLYVGETVKSNQRWKGEHDCKRYLDNYRMIHYTHQLPTRLNIAFWQNAPKATRPRQHLESALIYRWRSPFNKENWTFWGTPFAGGKP